MRKKEEFLKKYFGFDSFRAIQSEAIDYILEKKDLLTILPTGSGKSLIYQLPSLMMSGTTVVISPLIALMQDQVASLHLNGISAGMLSSSNSNQENEEVYSELMNSKLTFLYVAPERFASQYFLDRLRDIDINFFVIDEAHCVSEWGHEFRDDYRKLKFLKTNFPNIPITAFTATATKAVEEDILKTLSIDFNRVLRSKLQRTNLLIRSQKRIGDGRKQIKEFLKTHDGECGIVYCFTRKETEAISDYLNINGFNTLAYHAGLPSSSRDEVFRKFKDESIKIVVATIAFGMGIDKSNIRFVLHTSMPKTLENYSQEIGRAGRDGLKADVLLLYAKRDEIGKKRFIDELPDSIYKKNNYKKLKDMYRFAITATCRHQFIAKYFGDEVDECKSICDNCLSQKRQYRDITVESQKFLSAIFRLQERFGQNYIIDILRGSKAKRVLDFGHDKLSVFAIGKDLSKEQWSVIVDALLDIEAILIDGEFSVLRITPIGGEILKNKRKVQIDASNLILEKSYEEYKQDEIKDEVFEKFRELRTLLAREENVPPYMIFNDKTLKIISRKLPLTKEQFLNISGVGEMKLEKYSNVFLSLSKSLLKDGIEPKKELSKTYLDTLELIKNEKTFKEICDIREIQESTLIRHVSLLFENKYITRETKNRLYKPMIDNFPLDIKKWIEDGLKISDISTLKDNLLKYNYFFSQEE